LTAIRTATAADVPSLLRLLQAMAAEAGESVGSTEASLLEHGFGATPRFRALLADVDGDPAGLCLYFAEYSTWRGQMGLYVQDIYVSPLARGSGMGRRLLAAALRDADWAPAFLTLMVARRNTSARAFYAGLGMGLRDDADQLVLDGQGLAALMAE
jgi:GNAT superfamily N-acetyltransferase